MNLLRYTFGKLSLLLFALLVAWGVLFYYTITYEVMDETDDTLRNTAQTIIKSAQQDPSVLQTEGNLVSFYYFRPISVDKGKQYRDLFYDSFVYVPIEGEDEPVRVMRTAFAMPGGQYYELELMLSTLERDDMVYAILWYLVALFTLFLLCTTFGAHVILRRTFGPLHKLVSWMEHLHPGKDVPPLDNPTPVREFQILSHAAVEMAHRSHKAYHDQKQFIENASHELQTPLAIARGKLELLVESDTLGEEQLREVGAIYDTLGRAVKLNKALLLLSRIENEQYAEVEDVSIDQILDHLLPDLMDIYQHKDIRLERRQGSEPFIVRGNPTLTHILVSNLVKNGLLHNARGGVLSIETSTDRLVVANTGDAPLDTEKLFRRFAHSVDKKKDSTGLGLAIAYAIARHTHLQLTYTWQSGMHVFTVVKESK